MTTSGQKVSSFPQTGEPPYELYDLEADPGETNYLYEKYPDIMNKLKHKITQIIENGRSTSGKPQDYVKANWPQLTWVDGAGTSKTNE